MDLTFMQSRGCSGHSPDNELRILRDRLRARQAARSNASAGGDAEGAVRVLVQTFAEGTYPTETPRFFAVRPVQASGREATGGGATFTADTGTSFYALFTGDYPAEGDYAVATSVGGRWVADKTIANGSPCDWWCPVTSIAIAPPTGDCSDPSAAIASLTVDSTDGSIASITLDDPGPGACYIVAHPAVTFTAGNGIGAGASATATVGQVTKITVGVGGGPYSSANPPNVAIAPPGWGKPARNPADPATATPVVNDDGALDSLTITYASSGYDPNWPPVILIDPPHPGIVATATATVSADGTLAELTIGNPGSKYDVGSPPSVLIAPPDPGKTARATARVAPDGSIAGFTIKDHGTKYDPASPPAVAIALPFEGGTRATGHAVVGADGTISALVVDVAGSRYDPRRPASVTIDAPPPGVVATAHAVVATGGTVSALVLDAPGTPYDAAIKVAVNIAAPAPGVPAVAHAEFAPDGSITDLILDVAGTKYDQSGPPVITIDAPFDPAVPEAVQATAHAVVDPATGAVTDVILDDRGALCQSASPPVVIDAPAGDGTRAVAGATAGVGIVTDLTLTAPGSGYDDPAPPDLLNMTISCPAWTVTVPMIRKAAYGITGGCIYSGTTTADIAGLSGVTVVGAFPTGSAAELPVPFQFGIAAGADPSQKQICTPYKSPLDPGFAVFKPMKGGIGTDWPPSNVELSRNITCSPRPFSGSCVLLIDGPNGFTANETIEPDTEPGDLYLLCGGNGCVQPDADGNLEYPQISLVVTISEAPPTDSAPKMAAAPRPSVDESMGLLKLAKSCPFASRDAGCGCSGTRCALKPPGSKPVPLPTCMACIATYGP